MIPDHSYAPLYAETVDDCREHGAFDPATMGTHAERRPDGAEGRGVRLARQDVRDRRSRARCASSTTAARRCSSTRSRRATSGACARPRTPPIRDWVALAVARARATGAPAVFWLDETRPHDAAAAAQGARRRSRELDTDGLADRDPATSPTRPGSRSRGRARGEDTISVTGNVLRDYLTDLFPILELGTSAKMLSIVPLMNGGGLFETGAGGSAPKHVQQFLRENHLRWDSLGEFLALAVSLEMLADKTGNPRAQLLAETLDRATGSVLEENRSPSRRGRRARQPRQPLLPRALLGAGARRRRPTTPSSPRASRRWPQRLAADEAADRRRARRGPGRAGRHRRLLPARPGARGGRDASERDAQRGARGDLGA